MQSNKVNKKSGGARMKHLLGNEKEINHGEIEIGCDYTSHLNHSVGERMMRLLKSHRFSSSSTKVHINATRMPRSHIINGE